MSAASRVSCPARLSFMYVASRSLSLIHISEPTRLGMISYAVFCLRLPHLSIRRQRQMCIRDTFVASALDVRSVTGLLPCPALLHVRRIALPVSYTHLRAHETRHDLVCRLLLASSAPLYSSAASDVYKRHLRSLRPRCPQRHGSPALPGSPSCTSHRAPPAPGAIRAVLCPGGPVPPRRKRAAGPAGTRRASARRPGSRPRHRG